MNSRRLIRQGILLVVLLGIGMWLRTREEATTTQTATVALLPPSLSVEEVSAVELSIGKQETPQVQLVRDPQRGWQVATAYNAPADPDRLKRFLYSFRGLSGEERAQGARWFGDFGVGEEGLQVRLRQGSQLVGDLVMGRSRKDPRMNFVRRQDEERIYSIESDLLGTIGLWGAVSPTSLSSRDWVKLQPFSFYPAELSDVEIYERAADHWNVRLERHQPFDEETRGWLDTVRTFRGIDVVDPKSQGSFQPRWRWMFKRQGGDRIEMEEADLPQKDSPVTIRLLPDGPYLTVTASAIQHLREQLQPPPGGRHARL